MMKDILRHARTRIAQVFDSFNVEISEFFSILLCLAWFVPILFSGDMLSASIPVQAMEHILPREWLFWSVFVLMLWQVFGAVLGGKPSGVINSDGDAVLWLQWRRMGMYLSGGLWAAVGYLMTLTAITGSTVLFGFGGFAMSIWGIVRFRSLIAEYRAVNERRKSEGVLAACIKKEGRLRSDPPPPGTHFRRGRT